MAREKASHGNTDERVAPAEGANGRVGPTGSGVRRIASGTLLVLTNVAISFVSKPNTSAADSVSPSRRWNVISGSVAAAIARRSSRVNDRVAARSA